MALKYLKRSCLPVLLIVVASASMVNAQPESPRYDMSGIWGGNSDPGGAHFFQNGSDVKGIYVNREFVQYFSGRYANPTTVEGVWLRKNRGNGCVTKMKDRIVLSSPDSISSNWIALDSNCDLAKGRTGSGASVRQKAVEERLWY